MTLQVLPPGGEPPDGGGPDDPDDESELSLMLGPLIDSAMEHAQAIRIPAHRLFCEGLALGMTAVESMQHARPDLKTANPSEVARAIRRAQSDPAVAKYIEAVLGVGAFTSGLSYSVLLNQIYVEASNPKNAAYVRVQALTDLADRMEANGVAKAEGFDVKSATDGDGDGSESGGMSDENADHFLNVLSAPTQVPALPEST